MSGDPEELPEPSPPSEELGEEEASTLNPTVDAGTPKGVRRQVISQKRREKDAKEFYTAVFASEIGRREMWDILRSLHTFETRFAVSPVGFPDPNATWFNAGEQAAGQRLFKSWLRIDREGVLLMMQEHDADLGSAK